MIKEPEDWAGTQKIMRIMRKEMWSCGVCGMTHEHRNAANGCCTKKKREINRLKEVSND